MGKNFLSATANFEDFISLPSAEINNHVQKNNEVVLKKVFTFFQSDSKILLINGFAGVGKKQVSEHTLSYLDKDTIILKYVCSESAKADDVFLSFLETLKQKTKIKDSSELEAIESVQDKIEYIFSKAGLRFVAVFYNFDAVKDENKSDILNYIYSISEKDFIKTVICARTFDTDIIPESIKYVKVMVKALSKELFETYLREFGIKMTPAMIDQLYRLSRGYFFSACICAKYMVNQELSLNDFIVQYTNSGEKFDLFIAKAYYKLIVGTTKSAFNLFVKLHHGLNLKVLQTIGSYPEVILKTLGENFYIYKKGKLFYPSEFLKLQLEEFIEDEISKKRLASYYEKQLALPPEERDFLISRASMQDEIAFYKGIEIEKKEPDAQTRPCENSEIKANDTNDGEQTAETKEETEDFSKLTLAELYTKAQETFNSYDYLKSIQILTALLDKKSEFVGSDLLYDTYELLARAYSKLTKWKYSLYYYDLLEKHYNNITDIENVYRIQFEQAHIFYQSYRIVDAIKILKTLVSLSKTPDIISKSNVLLGNIALSASNKPMALEYYKEGIKNITDSSEKQLKMELFFKYAILSDENNDMNSAVEYYQKCIEINDTTSKYKALAYSNLGDLFRDNELFEEAKECFENAYEADKVNNNEYGMYYSLSNVIELTNKKEKDKLVKMAVEAKEHALKTDDYNALLMSVIKLGDIYYDYPEPEKALEEYMALYKEGVEVIEEPNFSMIKARIEDIKARLGEDKFKELVPDYE